MPATEPSAEGAVANEGTPANEAPIRTARKGAPRDKTVEPPSPKAPAGSKTRAASRGPDATPAHAPARELSAAAGPATQAPVAAPRVEPTPVASPFPGVEAADEFNRTAAMEAMRHAGDASRSCVAGGVTGGARVAVTFARSGSPADVGVEGSFAGSPVGTCIAAKFRALRIPPFRGSSVTVRRTLSF